MRFPRRLLAFVALLPALLADTPDDFSAKINPAEFDAPKLSRAIFAETNRVRHELELPLFDASAAANDAAAIQASLGWLPGQDSHTNPFPGVSTLPERIERVGLKAARAGENAARLPIIDSHGQNQFGIRLDTEVKTPIDLQAGETLETHSYASFARDIVHRWMQSPGHRANLTQRNCRVLGVAVHLLQPKDDFAQVYAVQVFIAPRPVGRKRLD